MHSAVGVKRRLRCGVPGAASGDATAIRAEEDEQADADAPQSDRSGECGVMRATNTILSSLIQISTSDVS